MPTVTFSVDRWFAWAPGIDNAKDWQTFFQHPEGYPIADDHKANVSFIPAMKRRRLSTLARAAFYAADKCLGEAENPPTIFCSLYGESQRTYDILSDISNQEDLSPMAFSLSVHNAISGQFSILQNLKTPSVAVAPGEEGYLSVFADAVGQLLEGQENVLLVFYEEPAPAFYREHIDTAPFPLALAVMISRKTADEAFSLTFDGESPAKDSAQLRIYRLIEFFTANQPSCAIGPWKIQRAASELAN